MADDDPSGIADPGRHDGVGILRGDERQRRRALEPREHRERRILEALAALQLVLEEVDDDLGVRLGCEAVPGRDEGGLQLLEVLDDPVVDDGGRAAAVDVRVRVLLRRPAVRRPAGVADARIPRRRTLRDDRGEVVELALRAADLEPPVPGDGDTGRVVAAVLELAQAAHQERERLTRSGVADDPAHD